MENDAMDANDEFIDPEDVLYACTKMESWLNELENRPGILDCYTESHIRKCIDSLWDWNAQLLYLLSLKEGPDDPNSPINRAMRRIGEIEPKLKQLRSANIRKKIERMNREEREEADRRVRQTRSY